MFRVALITLQALALAHKRNLIGFPLLNVLYAGKRPHPKLCKPSTPEPISKSEGSGFRV